MGNGVTLCEYVNTGCSKRRLIRNRKPSGARDERGLEREGFLPWNRIGAYMAYMQMRWPVNNGGQYPYRIGARLRCGDRLALMDGI
jgi:hypothetical protein